MSNLKVMSSVTYGAGIALGFGASIAMGFGAGIAMGFGAGFTLRGNMNGPQGIADSVMEKLGFEWSDILFALWDPEKAALEAEALAHQQALAARKRKTVASRRSAKPTAATVMRRRLQPEAKASEKAETSTLAVIFRKRASAPKMVQKAA